MGIERSLRSVFKSGLKFLKRLDKVLLLLCVGASLFSAYMLYTMYQNGINPSAVTAKVWKTQLGAAAVGFVCALVITAVKYNFLLRIWYVYSGLALVLSLLLFTPLGMSTPGSREINWLNLGFMQIQPSEFLMVAFIATFAAHLSKIGGKLNQLPHFMLLCLHVMAPVGIITLQGNTGTSVILLSIFITMLFAAGLSWKYFLAGIVSIPALGWAFWNFYAKDYQKNRILVIFDKELQQREIKGIFHQQNLSLIALGSGGLTGQGVSGGEYTSIFGIHNDFIFSYIGMTLGFVGCVATLALLMFICVKILSVMSSAKDLSGRLLCAGVFALFFTHSVLNVGMATVVLPVIGVPLPLISSGGSSTLSMYCAVGLVTSVRAHREKEYHLFYTEKD